MYFSFTSIKTPTSLGVVELLKHVSEKARGHVCLTLSYVVWGNFGNVRGCIATQLDMV